MFALFTFWLTVQIICIKEGLKEYTPDFFLLNTSLLLFRERRERVRQTETLMKDIDHLPSACSLLETPEI